MPRMLASVGGLVVLLVIAGSSMLAHPQATRAATPSTPTQVVTRYYATTLSSPSPGAWQLVPPDDGVPTLPWQQNQLLCFQWTAEVEIGSGTADAVQLHFAVGPLGHPGGAPVLIASSGMWMAGEAPAVHEGSECFPIPLDLNAFFAGGQFSAQPLEGQLEVDPFNDGSVGSVHVVLTLLTTS